jgi:hypothetical protein
VVSRVQELGCLWETKLVKTTGKPLSVLTSSEVCRVMDFPSATSDAFPSLARESLAPITSAAPANQQRPAPRFYRPAKKVVHILKLLHASHSFVANPKCLSQSARQSRQSRQRLLYHRVSVSPVSSPLRHDTPSVDALSRQHWPLKAA